MFFITEVTKNCISVKDTTDNAVDKLTINEVLQAERMGYNISGIVRHNGQIYFCPYTLDLIRLDDTQVGTPVRVKLSKGLGFKQTLFVGKHFSNGKLIFNFYDDSGITGCFGLSSEYIAKNDVSFDFSNNDTIRVATLVKRLKDSGGC